MYSSNNFKKDSDGYFAFGMPNGKPLKILQLTDLHFGFGILSGKADKMVMRDVTKVINKAKPDLIILTGDSIFPFLPRAGTRNNIKQAHKLIEFMDSFKTPYALIFGNHDIEMGSKADKEKLAEIFKSGKYSIFDEGEKEIYGVGNYIIKLVDNSGNLVFSLVMLDSNMYGKGWFFSGFDCIHSDQICWCMDSLNELKNQNKSLQAIAFFHMPLLTFKNAYEKMKLGDKSVQYNFGSVAEENDYFGVSKYPCDFFKKAVQNGVIKGMFCGHDHYNTLSLTYKGIMMTYGMSMDYLGYPGIKKRYSQRGGTMIEVSPNGTFNAYPLPAYSVVSTFVRGKK